MQIRAIKHENLLYLGAFLLAAALRFIQLGTIPLSDVEAEWALTALNVAEGTRPLLGSQLIYILPTSALFFLFGSADFLARFIPALIGSALVFVPYLFRDRLKPLPGLLLAYFLALDPGLVSLSRQAGSLIPALTYILLTWAFWRRQRPRAAGVFGGLAVLSGPSFWAGLLGLGLAWTLNRTLLARSTSAERGDWEDLKEALSYGFAAVLLGGTMFFLSPNGLSSWLNALPEYLAGWVRPSGVPISRLLFALLIYQPLAILFGLLAVVRGRAQKDSQSMSLSLWLLIALAVTLFYPARQVSDLAWMLIPLWTLAALELSNHLNAFPEERREVIGVVVLVVILLIFSWINYSGIALDPANLMNLRTNEVRIGGFVLFEGFPPMRYALLFGVLLLLIVSITLVGLGWSAHVARLGLLWGLLIALGIYSLGMTFGGTGLRTPGGWELWRPGTQPFQADWLLATVNEQSEWSTGDEASQDVVLLNVQSPALEWLLRDRNVKNISATDSEEAPPIIISSIQATNPNLPIAYRGQDFIWRRVPIWSILTVHDWIKWSVFRVLPYDSEFVIVWVRNDLFVDSNPSLP